MMNDEKHDTRDEFTATTRRWFLRPAEEAARELEDVTCTRSAEELLEELWLGYREMY
jgi:hypothetical protein